MTLIAQDTFTGVNGTNLTAHTMDIGSGWTAASGTATIFVSGGLDFATNTTNTAWYVTSTTASDVSMQLDLVSLAPGYTGFILRYLDVNNFIWCVADKVDFSPATKLAIWTRVAGVNSLKASAAFGGTPDTVFLTALGTTVTLSDGTNSCSATISNFSTQTTHGLYFAGGANGTVDNFNVWSLTTVTTSEKQYADALATPSKTDKLNTDSLTTITRTDKGLMESLISVARKASQLIDALATPRPTMLIPMESLATPVLATPLSIDTTLFVTRTAQMRIDSLISVSRTDTARAEANATAMLQAPMYVSVLSQPKVTWPVPMESLTSEFRTWDADLESLLQRNDAIAIPMESLATPVSELDSAPDTRAVVSFDTSMLLENLRNVSRTDSAAVEGLQSIANTESVPEESLATPATTEAIPITSMATVASNLIACIDALTDFSGGMVTPVEWLRSVADNEIIPVEWGKLPDPEQVWIADARGNVWVSPARSCTWVAQPRSNTWKPKG